MACTNNSPCFSGCVETVSDKCVKYTGASISFLGIESGDTLCSIEEKITDYLSTVLTGDGILPEIDAQYICDVVKQFLPCEECGAPTLVEILTALVRAICAIEEEIVIERERIDDIESNYTLDCLTGVSADSGTHAVLQAVITSLCESKTDISTIYSMFGSYVKSSDLNTLIQAYLDSQSSSNLICNRMVPYAIYPFYPTEAFLAGLFDSTGAGLGTWKNIYLCNGNNHTPDLRGRSPIGTTYGSGMDTSVNPGVNPAYDLGDKNGSNTVVLSRVQMPPHVHPASVTITDPGHQHLFASIGDLAYAGGYNFKDGFVFTTAEGTHYGSGSYYTKNVNNDNTPQTTGISGSITVAADGGGQGHDNVHPVLAVYYIMYIPL